MIRTVLGFSALIALVSTGLPAAASAPPPAASTNTPSSLTGSHAAASFVLDARGMLVRVAGGRALYPLGIARLLQFDQAGATGCPGQPPPRGGHCVPLPVSLIRQYSYGPGTCSAIMVMQVPLLDGIVEYEAEWTAPRASSSWAFYASGGPDGSGSGPYSEEYWSTKEVKSPGGTVYKVPRGLSAL